MKTKSANKLSRAYDRNKMQQKKNILRFQWGAFPAIGIQHFEVRRDERIKSCKTNIFGKTAQNDEQVLLSCFKILRLEKYNYILERIVKKEPRRIEWLVGFETDEKINDESCYKYVFIVFSISVKQTSMNGIKKGQKFLSCITVVKDYFKNRHKTSPNTIEQTLCYSRLNGSNFGWTNSIPRAKKECVFSICHS